MECRTDDGLVAIFEHPGEPLLDLSESMFREIPETVDLDESQIAAVLDGVWIHDSSKGKVLVFGMILKDLYCDLYKSQNKHVIAFVFTEESSSNPHNYTKKLLTF